MMHVEPKELIDLAVLLSWRQFADGLDFDVFALVELDGRPAAFRHQLALSGIDDPASVKPWLPRAESTGTHTMRFRPADVPTVDALAHEAAKDHGIVELQTRLSRGHHYIFPLRKRAHSRVTDRDLFSVGRARDNDLVLFDPSASKLHVCFDYDDRDRYFVTDWDSTNGTQIGARRVTPGERTRCPMGKSRRPGRSTLIPRRCGARTRSAIDGPARTAPASLT
ncbi:MAG: FHA domain-containing protein [Myxococcota bacterium]